MPPSGKFRVFFVPTSNAGVNYYRMASYAWQMRKMPNVETHVYAFQYKMDLPHPWQDEYFEKRVIREEIANFCNIADVVIFQPVGRPQTLEFFMELKAALNKPMLVETDDNFIDVPTWNEAFSSYAPGQQIRNIALKHLQMADGLIVSTPFLKRVYSQFNSNINVVPNAIDFDLWDGIKRRPLKGCRMGWIGGRSHVNDLLMIAPVLRKVLEENPTASLSIVNSGLKNYAQATNTRYVFEGLGNVSYTDRTSQINLYPRFMSSFRFDMGLAPLVDCNFNRSKSNLRWLEYSALGIPTVASKISHFQESISHTRDGVLIENNDLDQWYLWLTKLVKDENLRKQIGSNANRSIRKNFNIKKVSADYTNLLKRICHESDPTLYAYR